MSPSLRSSCVVLCLVGGILTLFPEQHPERRNTGPSRLGRSGCIVAVVSISLQILSSTVVRTNPMLCKMCAVVMVFVCGMETLYPGHSSEGGPLAREFEFKHYLIMLDSIELQFIIALHC